VERADLCPVEGHQQRLLALLGEPTDAPGHRIGDVNPIVVTEPPGALNPALGGVAGEAPPDGRKGGPPGVSGSFDQVGKGFSLALAQLGGYCENPADDPIGTHGGSSAGWGKGLSGITLLPKTPEVRNRLLFQHLQN
jgi:hypothetical protein